MGLVAFRPYREQLLAGTIQIANGEEPGGYQSKLVVPFREHLAVHAKVKRRSYIYRLCRGWGGSRKACGKAKWE